MEEPITWSLTVIVAILGFFMIMAGCKRDEIKNYIAYDNLPEECAVIGAGWYLCRSVVEIPTQDFTACCEVRGCQWCTLAPRSHWFFGEIKIEDIHSLRDYIIRHYPGSEMLIVPEEQPPVDRFWEKVPLTWGGMDVWIKRPDVYDRHVFRGS